VLRGQQNGSLRPYSRFSRPESLPNIILEYSTANENLESLYCAVQANCKLQYLTVPAIAHRTVITVATSHFVMSLSELSHLLEEVQHITAVSERPNVFPISCYMSFLYIRLHSMTEEH
jgi:hypothetical protein